MCTLYKIPSNLSIKDEKLVPSMSTACFTVICSGHGSHGTAESRTRYWNAYMLFYEEVKESSNDGGGAGGEAKGVLAPPLVCPPGDGTQPISPVSPLLPESGDKLTQLQVSITNNINHNIEAIQELFDVMTLYLLWCDDPLPSLLQALVQKGEKHHMFSDSIPATIQRSVNEENLQFMQHRDVYCPEYLEFIYRLTLANSVS